MFRAGCAPRCTRWRETVMSPTDPAALASHHPQSPEREDVARLERQPDDRVSGESVTSAPRGTASRSRASTVFLALMAMPFQSERALARSGTVRTANRIDSVPRAPSPTVASAPIGCALESTTDDTRTPVHMAQSAWRFADDDIPPCVTNRSRLGPNHGCVRSHRSNRGELFEKQYEAARTNTVVGSPGTTTPAAANTTAHQPRPPKTTLVGLARRNVFVTGTSLTPWPRRRRLPLERVETTSVRASAPAGGIPRTPDARA